MLRSSTDKAVYQLPSDPTLLLSPITVHKASRSLLTISPKMEALFCTVLFCTIWVSFVVTRVEDKFTYTKWMIWMYTSNVSEAGSTNDVSLQIFGSKSNSEKVYVPYDKLPTGVIKSWSYITGIEHGGLRHIEMTTMNRERNDPWHLDRIEMRREDDDQNRYVFSCHCWLGGLQTVKTFRPDEVLWIVTVTTDFLGNTHPDEAYMKIIGSHGETDMISLYQPGLGFKSGAEVTIELITKFVGVPKQIVVKHGGTDPTKRYWYLLKIVLIKDIPYTANDYQFICACNLDKRSANDSKTVELANPGWRITVITCDKDNAGTNGGVVAQFGGGLGNTRRINLHPYIMNDFRRSARAIFLVNTMRIGTPRWLVMTLTSGYDWCVSSVEIMWRGDVESKYIFKFDEWLTKNKPHVYRNVDE